MRALAIDDSSFIRSFLHSLLTAHGIENVEAVIGDEGLDFLRHRGPFAGAHADWNMPGLAGLDVIRNARADRSFDTAKIVMVSTEAENNRMDAALCAGADEYIVKPFGEAGLFEKLRMAEVEGL
jgi:two-component system chemotaxis response regulator CheY